MTTTALGPGTLKIGAVGSEVDYSCQVNSMSISTAVSTTDSTRKLCGTEQPGVTDLSGTLAGNVDIDIDAVTALPDTSLFRLSSDKAATIQSFVFIPNNAGGVEARGKVLITPLDFGNAAGYGEAMTSDISWATVGNIAYYKAGAIAWTQVMGPRPGVTLYQPLAPGGVMAANPAVTASDATNAAKLTGLGYVAAPTTPWTTGQKVTIGTYDFNWSGTAWAAGAHA